MTARERAPDAQGVALALDVEVLGVDAGHVHAQLELLLMTWHGQGKSQQSKR
jgi:hypothetical protein